MKIVHNINKTGLDTSRKIYKCSICDKLFNWDKNSSWHGTLRQMDDDPRKLTYFCSDKCQNKYKKSLIKN